MFYLSRIIYYYYYYFHTPAAAAAFRPTTVTCTFFLISLSSPPRVVLPPARKLCCRPARIIIIIVIRCITFIRIIHQQHIYMWIYTHVDNSYAGAPFRPCRSTRGNKDQRSRNSRFIGFLYIYIYLCIMLHYIIFLFTCWYTV